MSATPRVAPLQRTLGFSATCAIIVCNMVGQGVFLKARVMTCNVGSPLLMIAAWVGAGLLALCGSLTLAELSAAIPESGGIYAFIRRAYGGMAAFAYGWMGLFVAGPASTAGLAAGGAIFFNAASGDALDRWSGTFAVAGRSITIAGTQELSVALIVIVALVNCAPALVNGGIAQGFAVLKLAMLAGITFAALGLGHGSVAHLVESGAGGACVGVAAATRSGLAGFAAALIGALYAYQGWQSATLLAGEVRNPGRVFPAALGIAVTVVLGCYVLANIAFVDVLGARAIASLPVGASVGVRVAETLLGPVWTSIAAALLFASVSATLHVTIMTNARVSYALAADEPAFALLGRVSTRGRVPVNAVLTNSAIAIVLLLIGSFDTLSDYLVFNSWVFFVATAGAVFVLRRREPSLARPYRTPGYPFVPAIFIIVAGWLLVQTLLSNPRNSLIGLAIVALSVPVHLVQHRRS